MEAVNVVRTDVLDNTDADTPVGAAGEVVIDVDAEDAGDVPLVFVAVTVKVYAVLGDNPDTSMVEEDPVPTSPPGELVTV